MITNIITYKAEISLTVPFPTSYGEQHLPTDHVFVEIIDSSGEVGYGEGTALSFFTGDTATTMKMMIDQKYSKALTGLTVPDAIRHFQEMSVKTQESPGAKAGVEIALLDLYCNVHQVPFYEVLGFKVREAVDITYTVGATDPSRAAASISDGLSRGFTFFKLKAQGQIKADLERITRVLEVMTPDCKVRIDANQGWDNFEKASKIMTQLDKLDQIEYIEQPVKRENLVDLKKLTQEYNIPIFADESCHTPTEATHLLVNEIVDGLCLKMAKAGGPIKIKLMADLAREFKKNVTMISAFGTSLDERVWINLAAVIPNLQSTIEMGSWKLETEPVTPIRGNTPTEQVSDDVGLGISLNKQQLD